MKFRTILIFISIILLFVILITKCEKTIITSLGGYVEKDTIIKIDTVIGIAEIDTLDFIKKYNNTQGIINNKPIIVYKWKDSNTNINYDTIKEFTTIIKDSLIEGTIISKNDFKGNLLDLKFNYTTLFPKYIEKTVPVYITKEVTNTLKNPIKSKIGIGTGINSESHISFNIGIIDKKGWDYRIHYTKTDLIIKEPLIPHPIIGFNITKYF